jgi:hypothetical protein
MPEGSPERRKSARRTGNDRRGAKERRVKQRRTKPPKPTTSTRGGGDRRTDRRRSGQKRRTRADRRGATRAHPEMSEGHRRRARQVPDEVMAGSGSASDRVIKVVRKTWKVAPMPVRAGLAQDLLPILEPLVNGEVKLTEELRIRCEEVVARWVKR